MNRVSQAGTGKVKPISILMKQEMMGWQWHQLDRLQIICSFFLHLLQTNSEPAPHHSIFYRPDALRDAQPTLRLAQP